MDSEVVHAGVSRFSPVAVDVQGDVLEDSVLVALKRNKDGRVWSPEASASGGGGCRTHRYSEGLDGVPRVVIGEGPQVGDVPVGVVGGHALQTETRIR